MAPDWQRAGEAEVREDWAAAARRDAARADEPPPSLRLWPGELVAGRYTVERLAGVGGMGAVYRASDAETGQPAALKVMTRHDGSRGDRFAREALVMAELSHPAIVRYIGHGSTATNLPFIAMEWLSGEDLSKRLAREPLTVGESLALLRRICEGLASAHQRGFVHRDIKPSNLFLVDGKVSAAKVLDFGLARRAVATRSLTRAGAVLGTVGYMAPEQATGARDLDVRADVFALGCVLFECLTGRPAFVGQHDVAVLAKVLRDEPPPVGALTPGLGSALDGLVARLLAKDRDARPADARAVCDALDALGPLGTSAAGAAPRIATYSERLIGAEQHIVSVILGEPARAAAPTLASALAADDGARLAELSRRYGAEPVPISGGALLLVLAARSERTAADQAAQAARCALALRQLRPELTLCVATGTVDTTTSVPMGAAIDRATALLDEPSARGEGVSIDELTAGLLDARFEVRRDAHGGRTLLGEQGELEAPRLLMGKPTPCVGREKELALLEATLDECIGDGVTRAVLITAAPGIGKSRLGRELVERVRAKGAARVLTARADPTSGGAALGFVQRLVRRAVGLRDGDAPVRRCAQLAQYLEALVSAEQRPFLMEFLGEIVDAPSSAPESALLRTARRTPEVMLEQRRRAIAQWLDVESAARPLVILLEDLHWGDLASLVHLEQAVRALPQRALFLVALGRPELHERFPKLWTALDVQELRLHGLTRRAAARLVEATLGRGPDDPLVSHVVALADGNALYLEELIRRVAEDGSTALPETVVALVQSRLERLPPEARRLLRAASVFGETFWTGGVARLLGEHASLAQDLALLEKREILEQTDKTRFRDEPAYVFRHAFFRDAAYAMLTDDDRPMAHRMAGDWLERAGERDARVLAFHFERGGAPERAVPYLIKAGMRALEAGDVADATALSRRGLALGATGSARGSLLLMRAYAAAYASEASTEGLSDMLALLPRGSANWWLALSLLVYGAAARDRHEEAAPYFAHALCTKPCDEITGVHGQALHALTAGMVLMGQSALGWQLIAHFDAHVREGVDQVFDAFRKLSCCQLATHAAREGRFLLEEALAWGRESVAVMQRAGSRAGHAVALFYLGNCCRIVGRYEEAERVLRESIRTSQTGTVLMKQYSELMLARVIACRGRVDDALALLAPLAHSLDANVAFGAKVFIAEAHARAGAFSLGLTHATLADAAPASPYWHALMAALARCQLALGQPAEARALCTRALEASHAPAPEYEADLQISYAEALFRLGDSEGARTALSRAIAFTESIARCMHDPAVRSTFLENVEAHARARLLTERLQG